MRRRYMTSTLKQGATLFALSLFLPSSVKSV
jgi:hypothetical protein